MSQFKRNKQYNNANDNFNKEADYLNDDQHDWAAMTQQWMLKTEKYCTDESIPPAPPPPNISYLCYFDEPIPDVPKITEDHGGRTPASTNVDRNRNGHWQPLNAVKTEPDENLHTPRNCGFHNDAVGTDSRISASRLESSSKGKLPPLGLVKVEPEDEPEMGTESSLYYGSSYVEGQENQENVASRANMKDSQKRQEFNTVKIEPEQTTETSLRNKNLTLGYLVYVENPRNGTLASSYQSTYHNSLSNDSEYWLPILTRIEDWPHIKDEFLSAVSRISAGIQFKCSEAGKVFKVCASLMNSAVVKVMENGRNELDNSTYINGFFSIYRILNRYAQDEKELIELSNRALTNFMSSPTGRVKKAVPNLGEFLMHLTISTQWTWGQISNVFMDEVDTRNVFWYCCANPNSPPAHPELINAQYRFDREAKVFHATTISRNLVMFQVKFAIMTKSMEFTEFCTNFGRVQDILTTKLKSLYGTVVAIKNWNQFYDFLQMPRVSLAKRNSDLAQAVTRSAIQGYHKRSAGAMRSGRVGSLLTDRMKAIFQLVLLCECGNLLPQLFG